MKNKILSLGLLLTLLAACETSPAPSSSSSAANSSSTVATSADDSTTPSSSADSSSLAESTSHSPTSSSATPDSSSATDSSSFSSSPDSASASSGPVESDLISALKESAAQEIAGNDSGTFRSVKNGFATSLSYTIYSSDKALIIDDASEEKIQYQKTGNDVERITLTKDSIDKGVILTKDENTDEEKFEGYFSSFTYNDVSTISNLVLNYLTDFYFSNGSLSFSEADQIYTVSKKVEKKTADRFYDSVMSLKFHGGRLLSAHIDSKAYDKNGYDFDAHQLKDNAQKLNESLTLDSSLTYEARKETDENLIDESKYRVQSFEILTEHLHEGKYLYVGESIPLEVQVTAPAIYLPDAFSIEDDGLNPTGIISASKTGNAYTLTALAVGTTRLTVTSSLGKTASIDITVTEVPPTGIEIYSGALTELDPGQRAEYKVNIQPATVKDKTFKAEFTDPKMADYATLDLDTDNSKFILTAKKLSKEQSVTVKVTANGNTALTDQITVKIKAEEAVASGLASKMIGKTYAGGSYPKVELTFTDASTGTVSLTSVKNTYVFNWTVDDETKRITYTNVERTSGSNNNYYFVGTEASYDKKQEVLDDEATQISFISSSKNGLMKATLTVKA